MSDLIAWFEWFNAYLWIGANLLIAYIGVALVVFVAGYYLLFDPKATTGGRLIFRFALSLVGVMGLIIISLFINPAEGRAWFQYPGDLFWWRPIVRFITYSYVAYTITSLTVLLGIRKWVPHIIQTAPDDNTLVKVRAKPRLIKRLRNQ